MKWFYMQAGAMPLLIAALAALYLRPGKRSPPEEADDGRQYYDGNGNHVYYDRPGFRNGSRGGFLRCNLQGKAEIAKTSCMEGQAGCPTGSL